MQLKYFLFFLVCLQPFEFDPNEKNRHKFMVQSLVAPEGEFNVEQVVSEFFFLLFLSSNKY